MDELTYDADGNLTNDSAFIYSWDCENRMIGASTTNMSAGYAYDYQSRRSQKIVNGTTTNTFLYDGWNLVSEICNTESQIVTNFYVWGLDLSGSLQGAGGIGGLLSVTRSTSSNTATYYPCYDANGNISDYVDTNGTVVAHREYDAFGNTIVATGSMVNDFNFWFSTKYLDQETGLYYFGYRYYDPVTGRWLSRDPIGEDGGANLYGFALNSPIANVDPLGLYTLLFNPWWSWSNQEIDQVANTFYSLYAVIGRANSLVNQRLSLLDKQPNSCPFKRPLIQQYKFAQKALNGIGKGLNNRTPWISIEKNSNPNRDAGTSGWWGSWRILLSNLGSQNDVLHELSHHYGTDDSTDPTLYSAHNFGALATGRGVGIINTVEGFAKTKYGAKTCCPLPPAN